jgi:hypothetical protein
MIPTEDNFKDLCDKRLREIRKIQENECIKWRDIRDSYIRKFGFDILNPNFIKELDKHHSDYLEKLNDEVMRIINERNNCNW